MDSGVSGRLFEGWTGVIDLRVRNTGSRFKLKKQIFTFVYGTSCSYCDNLKQQGPIMAWHRLIPQAPQLFATGRMHDFGPSIILDLIRTLVCG